jgi:hypothetical protein
MRPPSRLRRAVASDAERGRWWSSRSAAGGGAWRTPSAVLGPDHPLSRAVDGRESVGRQSRVVGAVLIGSMIDFTQGATWAAAAALSAVTVLVGLAIGAAALTQSQRDRALDLIIEGHESVPVAAVQRERQRLHAPGTQRRLARAIDGVIDQALNPPKMRGRGVRPLFEIVVVAFVAEDLRAISQLLGAQHASIRGVALAERLVSDGTSPLYRDQADGLRGELQRIHDLMTDSPP